MVTRISIPNNDSHIIDRDRLWLEVSRTMTGKKPITIDLNGEGPCARSLGLYDLLDRALEHFDYAAADIEIVTCNLLEKHDRYKISIQPQMMYLQSARAFASTHYLASKQFDSTTRCVGNFIGHGNQWRLYLASQIDSRHARQVLQTYHYSRANDYHRPFVGIDNMLAEQFTWQDVGTALKFLEGCPRIIDEISQYPILNPTTLAITQVYHRFFVELVNLTYFTGDTFYIDEKIWRPMIMRTPFLVQGPRHFIQNLRKLGFQTFDAWWDEGYSQDPEPSQSTGILSVIDSLCNKSVQELQEMYRQMQSVLDHNHQRLMTITSQDFRALCQN